jgi:dCMP deaminase
MLSKWDIRFLNIAEQTAQWSKDKSVCGCIIVNDENNILAGGYNGFPRNVKDDDRLLTRDIKLLIVVHAEANAIASAARNGINIKGCTAYINRHPCSQCAALLIQAGIKRVIWTETETNIKWKQSHDMAEVILSEANIVWEGIKC